MGKKSNNKKQDSKQQRPQRASTRPKGAKGAITSKGDVSKPIRGDVSASAQNAELKDAVEALRDAASALSQSAVQPVTQPSAAEQATLRDVPVQSRQPQAQQLQPMQDGQETRQPDEPSAQVPNAAAAHVPPQHSMLQPTSSAPQPAQPASPGQMPLAGVPQQAPQNAPAVPSEQKMGPASGQPNAPRPDQTVPPLGQMPAHVPGQMPAHMPMQPTSAAPGAPGFTTNMPSPQDPIARVSHNTSMGIPVGFMPKEPEKKRRWGSPIQSLKTAFASLTNRNAAPLPSPEPAMLSRAQIDYMPKPELLLDLPKFGEVPAVLPSPQELLASVPAISMTGQIMPAGTTSAYSPYLGDMMQSEQLAIPAMYGSVPSFSAELPAEQIMEVPAQGVVYGETQMPDPYLQTYNNMAAYDPSQMYDPHAMSAYDPNAMYQYDPMQMQSYDPMQMQQMQQMQDPMQLQQSQQPFDMYQQDPLAMQGFDPSVHGTGFEQAPYDSYGYGRQFASEAPLPLSGPVKNGKATAAFILGILSILLAFVPPVGLILALIAFFLVKSYHKKGGTASRAGTARVCAIVGIVLSLVIAVALAVFIAYFYGGLHGQANAGIIMSYLQMTPLKGIL